MPSKEGNTPIEMEIEGQVHEKGGTAITNQALLKGTDKIHLTLPKFREVEQWMVTKTVELFGKVLEGGDTGKIAFQYTQVEQQEKYLRHYLFAHQPFEEIIFSIFDTSEVSMEYAAMQDIQNNNGEYSAFSDTTKKFLKNIVGQITPYAYSVSPAYKKLGFKEKPRGFFLENEVRGALINYYMHAKDDTVIMGIPLTHFSLYLNFQTKKMELYATGYVYEGKLEEDVNAGKLAATYSKQPREQLFIGGLTFDEAIALAMAPTLIYDEQQQMQGTSNHPAELGKFYFKELAVGAVFFLQYMHLPNTVEKATTTRKVSKPTSGSTKKKKGKSLRFTTLKTTTFTVKNPRDLDSANIEELNIELKRAYEYVLDKWTVRGHWRTYKNGNRVWITPQTRKRSGRDASENLEDAKKNYLIPTKTQ